MGRSRSGELALISLGTKSELLPVHGRIEFETVQTDVVQGKLVPDGRPVEVAWANGVFLRIEVIAEVAENAPWIAPLLFDPQVNGYAGIDFQRDGLVMEELEAAAERLQADGCGRFLLTLITEEWTRLTTRLEHLKQLREQSDLLRKTIAGWHVEGPFLSNQPGFHGAHNPKWMFDPKPDHIRRLREITAGDPLLLTLAPERAGAIPAIETAVSLGFRVSLGHTNASAAEIADAIRAGATGFTHLGNACPKELDRHDNILWRVLDTEGLTVGLIVDGMHVSGPFFRLVHRVLGMERIYYTTDAMAAAGARPGRYTMGELKLDVGPDQVVREPGKTNFAGSALRPIDGISRAARMLRAPWQTVWPAFSVNPERFMGIPNSLTVGSEANFCLLEADPAEMGIAVYVRGVRKGTDGTYGT